MLLAFIFFLPAALLAQDRTTIDVYISPSQTSQHGWWDSLKSDQAEERHIKAHAQDLEFIPEDSWIIGELNTQATLGTNSKTLVVGDFLLAPFFPAHIGKMGGKWTVPGDGGEPPPWDASGRDLLDLDVDSDNNEGYSSVERSDREDQLEEDDGEPGKIFQVNDGDLDDDAIPDFADGFDAFSDETDDDTLTPEGDAVIPFIPVVLQIYEEVDLNDSTITFNYPESDPAQVTRNEVGRDADDNPVYEYQAPAGLRLWLKREGARDKASVAEDGDFIPVDTELKPADFMSGHTITLYLEATPGAEELADPVFLESTLKTKDPLGATVTFRDKVKVRPIVMQFVTKDEGGGIVPTDFVGVCTPRPEIKLATPQVRVAGNNVRVTIRCDEILDPVADNLPRGVADIADVAITVNGSDHGTASVRAVAGGAASFWRQHPYKGTFNPVNLSLPLEEGTHTVRVTTSKNAAGLTGFDEFAFTLAKETTGGGGGGAMAVNIHLPVEPTPQVADRLQYYFGTRNPLADDPWFAELPKQPASLVFHSELDGLPAQVRILGRSPRLTPQIDSFNARAPVVVNDEIRLFTGQFTETGPETNLFRYTLTIPGFPGGGRERWKVKDVVDRGGSGKGTYYPYNVRVKGIGDPEEVKINLCGIADYELEPGPESWLYLKGGSFAHGHVNRSFGGAVSLVMSIFNPTSRQIGQYQIGAEQTLGADFKYSERKVEKRKAEVDYIEILSNTDNCIDRDGDGWPEISPFDESVEERVSQEQTNPVLIAVSDKWNKNIAPQKALLKINKPREINGIKVGEIKLRFDYDDNLLNVYRGAAGSGTLVPAGKELGRKEFPQLVKTTLFLVGVKASKEKMLVEVTIIYNMRDGSTVLHKDQLHYVTLDPVRVLMCVGYVTGEKDELREVASRMDEIGKIFKKTSNNPGVGPAGRFDLIMPDSFTKAMLNDAVLKGRKPGSSGSAHDDYLNHLLLVAHGTAPLFGRLGNEDLLPSGHPYIQVRPCLSEEDWKTYTKGVWDEKWNKDPLIDESHPEGIFSNYARRLSNGQGITPRQLQEWKTLVGDFGKLTPIDAQLRLISYMAWTTSGGGKAIFWPKSLFPAGFKEKNAKVDIMQFTCFNYWAGGASEDWGSSPPYRRAGWEVGDPATYKGLNDMDGWGSPGVQYMADYRNYVRDYIEKKVLDKGALYCRQPLR